MLKIGNMVTNGLVKTVPVGKKNPPNMAQIMGWGRGMALKYYSLVFPFLSLYARGFRWHSVAVCCFL